MPATAIIYLCQSFENCDDSHSPSERALDLQANVYTVTPQYLFVRTDSSEIIRTNRHRLKV